MANNPKQKGIDAPERYFGGGIDTLFSPFVPYENYSSLDAAYWRMVSRRQPVIMVTITSLIMKIQALPWTIRAKNADETDELDEKIKEHKRIILEFGGWGYLNGIDLILQDYYMTPFGGAAEPVKYSSGKLYKLVPYDAATLFPTLNSKFPVIQRVGVNDPVAFREDELVRLFSPRPEIQHRGWGIAPIEKVYLAAESLSRGDRYYAQLLLDTPEAGLLDLGDMSKESAEKWLESFRNMMSGIDAFKIPVIYQHTKEAKWIPFGRPPTDMMFDAITFKYAQLVCAAFGITTSDIGLRGNSGGSLSGEIRQERTSRSTGFASIKSKLTEFFNKILPEDLEFAFIDTDDELLVAKGRARSANAVAGRNLIESGAITPIEWRKQLAADGLLTIPLTEEPDEEAFEILKEIDGTADQLELQEKQLDVQQKIAAARPATGASQGGKGLTKKRNVRGGRLESVQGKEPSPASAGGQGEIKSVERTKLQAFLDKNFETIRNRMIPARSRRVAKMAIKHLSSALETAGKIQTDYEVWKSGFIASILTKSDDYDDATVVALSNSLTTDKWWIVDFDNAELAEILEERYTNGLKSGARLVQEAKYEDGEVDTPEVGDFEPTGEADIYAYAEKLSELINTHLDFYIKHIALASVVDVSNSNTQFDEIFLSSVVEKFEDNFNGIMDYLTTSIANIEEEKLFNKGVEEQRQKSRKVLDNDTERES